jgi:lipopolysaccharide export system permease protein
MIISLIYLIKISTLTSQISLSFKELLTLYGYSVPEIIFYTIPLSFVGAVANLFARLSNDNELIALFSLGVKSDFIVKQILLIAVLFSILLLSISFLAIPITKQYYKSFKEEKKSNAQFTLNAGKLGQKFGDYYIYIKSKDKSSNKFNNIVIYSKDKNNQEQFFASKSGELLHKGSTTILELYDGYGYTYDKKTLQEAKYKHLRVYKNIQTKKIKLYDIINYWKQSRKIKKIKQKAFFMIFVSLIPILSLYLIASFTIINPRYQKNHTYIVIFSITLILYTIASILHKQANLYLLLGLIIAILISGKILFNKKVMRYF